MAQPQAQSTPHQQRPAFAGRPSFPNNFQPPNGRTPQFSPQSPPGPVTYSSPSPQTFSPQFGQAPPPPKRQRLSPEAASPFTNPPYPQVSTPQAPSPVPAQHVNGNLTAPVLTRPGSMPPPQRPPEKDDRDYDNILSGTGINIEEEARNLARQDYYNQPAAQSSFQSGQNNYGSYQASFGQPSPASGTNGQQTGGVDGQTLRSEEEIAQREQQRLDWEASRHSQHELWDMFLYGSTLNDKIKSLSQKAHLVDAQSGVLVNTQKNAPPPTVRVNGLEGATRVISQGQSILDTKEKAERLSEVMKLLSLSAKARLTGLLNTSARLAIERRLHSKGRVPDEWADLAVTRQSEVPDVQGATSPNGSTAMKRTHSQANSETVLAHPAVASFEKLTDSSRTAEQGRMARRAKRKSVANPQDGEASTTEAEALMAAALDPEKKTTKKERKLAESKFSEQQQHKSANEAARLATSGIIGSRFGGKKSKSYSWMTGGGAVGGGGGGGGGAVTGGASSSVTSTPSRALGSVAGTPAAATTSSRERGSVVSRVKGFEQWDEDKDGGIQARDLLFILETDGRAARSFVKGNSTVDH